MSTVKLRAVALWSVRRIQHNNMDVPSLSFYHGTINNNNTMPKICI